MDDARRKELLSKFPPPWAFYHSTSEAKIWLGMKREGGGAVELLGVERARLAFEYDPGQLDDLLCEAFNAHFGNAKGGIAGAVLRLETLAGLSHQEPPSADRVERTIAQIVAWKRDSEELKVRTSLNADWNRFVSRMLELAGGERGADSAGRALLALVEKWRSDSEELAEIRKDEEAPISPEMDQAFADLARQDCRRAATRLGKLFDWNKAEALLAGEILFMELRSRERPSGAPQVSVAGAIDGGRIVGTCPTSHSALGQCERGAGHLGHHIAKGVAWGCLE